MGVRIIERDEWGAKPPKGQAKPHVRSIYLLVVHHAAGYADDRTVEGGALMMRRVQALHQDENGWLDAGYHYVISRGGFVYQGRPEDVQGAHVAGLNDGTLGICLLGCYEPSAAACPGGPHVPTGAQEKALVDLLAELMSRLRLTPEALAYHQEHYNTLCPGATIVARMGTYRREIATALAATPAEVLKEQVTDLIEALARFARNL